ncbi:MAG: putative DNA binding domain-containing protein [Bacteroidaceae bacterium]|nr:putative DNA binding domain-containing protein [Bacteroidaceae bacterium]
MKISHWNAKKAEGGIPNSLWETYSSFANTDGGTIILGVEEKDEHRLVVTGIKDEHKMIADFWNMVNNHQKVNINILTNRMVNVHEIDGKKVIVIEVPRADRRHRPVYVGTDPMKGTYRREFEGDYLCTHDQVAALYRDASDVSVDQRVLKEITKEVFDKETISRYRNRFSQFHSTHVWNDDDDDLFLRHIGAMALCSDDMKFHPTAAGLLMFGREYDIVREFPHYFLDYQEKLSADTRWTHRIVSSSGDWSGNLYDFFFRVYPRVTSDLPIPFITNGKDREDETKLHLSIREVLLNSLAHADHYGRQGVVVIKSENSLSFANPGDIRIGLKVALQGGVSDPRNATIMKMFSLVDVGERAGSGIPDLMATWEEYVKATPEYKIKLNPARTETTLPYTIKALQDAGGLLAEEKGGLQGGLNDKEGGLQGGLLYKKKWTI